MAETKQVKSNGFGFVIFLLIVLGFALYYNQWVTLEKLSNAVNPIARYGTFADFFKFLSLYGNRIFDGMDSFMFFLIILIPCLLIIMELRKSTLSQLVERAPKTDSHLLIYLGVISLFCMRYYFAIGKDPYNGDSTYFFFLVNLMTQNFKEGIIFPFYTFMHGGGAATNQFYGPLHSYIAGAINTITGNIHFSVKVTMFSLHLLSVFGVFLFVKELTSSKKAGFISGLAMILLYLHPHLMIFQGRYGEGVIWAIYPFMFLFCEKILNNKGFKYTLLLALSSALILLASIGMSYYFFLFIGFYILFRGLTSGLSWKDKLIFWGKTGSGLILGLVISSYYIYSFFIEAKWNITAEAFGKNKIAGIEPGIFAPLLLWNNYQISLFKMDIPWQSTYLGLTLALLSFIGLPLIFKNKENKYIPLVLLLILILFFIIGYGKVDLLLKIPFFHTYTQSRLLNIVAFMVILCSGIGYLLLEAKVGNKVKKLFLLVVILIFVDLFPTTFHDTYGKRYGGDATPHFDRLRQEAATFHKKLPDFRLDILGYPGTREVQDNWRAYDSFVPETGIPIIFESGNDYISVLRYIRYFHDHIYAGNKGIGIDDILSFYYLFNTKYILTPYNIPSTFFSATYRSGATSLYEIKNRSPLILSTKVSNSAFSTNDFIDTLRNMKINLNTATAQVFHSVNGSSEELTNSLPDWKLINHVLKLRGPVITIENSGPAFALLSYAAYPTVKVFLNGKQIKYSESINGNIIIKIPAGQNVIKVKPARSKGALFFFLLSLGVFLLVSIILIGMNRKKKKETGNI